MRARNATENRADLWQRLRFQYGSERATAIITGKDEATRKDINDWRLLGLFRGGKE